MTIEVKTDTNTVVVAKFRLRNVDIQEMSQPIPELLSGVGICHHFVSKMLQNSDSIQMSGVLNNSLNSSHGGIVIVQDSCFPLEAQEILAAAAHHQLKAKLGNPNKLMRVLF
jgi:hypothetical protein